MKKPFFVNFLENQISKKESNEIKAGNNGKGVSVDKTNKRNDVFVTLKYPSDTDE